MCVSGFPTKRPVLITAAPRHSAYSGGILLMLATVVRSRYQPTSMLNANLSREMTPGKPPDRRSVAV